MYKWKSNQGDTIYWFNSREFKENKKEALNGGKFFYRSFLDMCLNPLYPWGYIIPGELDLTEYLNKFVSNIDEKSTLYFDNSSIFPKTRLPLINIKRTTNLYKANIIVLNKAKTLLFDNYYIFTNGYDWFGINSNDLNIYFDGNLNALKHNDVLGIIFDEIQLVYFGRITLIMDEFDTIKKFYSKEYTQNFIEDFDLNKIVNQVLPDPTLDQLISIKQMLDSPDSSIVKLGALMACGYNITKWPLTFRVLLSHNPDWHCRVNGGFSKELFFLWENLNLKQPFHGISYTAILIDSLHEAYSEEDINLAKDFAKTLPDLKDFCDKNQKFYLDSLPFIPDEYKK